MCCLIASASPRRCRPGLVQQGEPRFVLHNSLCGFCLHLFHSSRHLFPQNIQQLSALKCLKKLLGQTESTHVK
ncbi:hypothetical protein CIB84_008554 [Bambusicola thoracicus]|uniref:Uncharacterized protein n=1 Tax=Bambusicola thoracicus TaxID=9083 RepID=A0A2P4SUA7_BAMTH|nr:hypothetical protein CIB84_008554 [Bambusicola thoracicus]